MQNLTTLESDTLTKKNGVTLGQHMMCLFLRGNSKLRTIKKERCIFKNIDLFEKYRGLLFNLLGNGLPLALRLGDVV